MPTRQLIELAINNHFDAWNSRDSKRWFANFTEDILLEDPIGGPTKIGPPGLQESWARSFQEGHSWRLEPLFMQICQNQAALHVRSYGEMHGESLQVDSIEIFTIDERGKVSHVRTYFNPEPGQELDSYFLQVT